MATSNSTDFNPTQQKLIRGALRNINAIATGETPSSAEMSEASEAFNLMIKAWQAEGMGLWLNDTFTITLVADQASYTMGTGGDVNAPRPLEVIEARFYYTSGGNEIPMIQASRQEYFDLSLKTSTGVPTQYYYDPQRSLGVFYIWPVWKTTPAGSIKGTVKTVIEDFDSLANTVDFPQEWLRALKFNLAIELAPEYGKEPSRTLISLAISSKMSVMDWDREKTGVYFTRGRR